MFLDGFESMPQDELNFSFRPQNEDDLSIAASGAGLEPSDPGDSAEPSPLDTTAQSEADAEMAAMLAHVAKSIGLEWTPPPCPKDMRTVFWGLSMTHRCTVPQFLCAKN